jgi:hypothetical protein
MLDPDPHLNQCGSTTLPFAIKLAPGIKDLDLVGFSLQDYITVRAESDPDFFVSYTFNISLS